ncbi:MAG: DUF1499 domain-containing protein [Alphaproteobacteria bacterium]|nr:DUF1499 domain-containing protein [Alphaproteobacteria bacterium]
MTDRPFPLDFANLERPSSPNTFLVLPAGFQSTASADLESPVFPGGPEAVLDRFRTVALATPRTSLVRQGGEQIELVQRSALFRFRDYVTVMAVATGTSSSSLCVYSRSTVGYSDLGVNAKRVRAWLNALADASCR